VSKVRQHCHTAGRFLGAVCAKCNLQQKYSKRKRPDNGNDEFFIPVIAHMKNYDSHLIIKSYQRGVSHDISVIPSNTKTYIAFQIGKLRFLDSFQFMTASLVSRVATLIAPVKLSASLPCHWALVSPKAKGDHPNKPWHLQSAIGAVLMHRYGRSSGQTATPKAQSEPPYLVGRQEGHPACKNLGRLPLVRLGWRPPGLSLPLPPFSSSAPHNPEYFYDGVQQCYWA